MWLGASARLGTIPPWQRRAISRPVLSSRDDCLDTGKFSFAQGQRAMGVTVWPSHATHRSQLASSAWTTEQRERSLPEHLSAGPCAQLVPVTPNKKVSRHKVVLMQLGKTAVLQSTKFGRYPDKLTVSCFTPARRIGAGTPRRIPIQVLPFMFTTSRHDVPSAHARGEEEKRSRRTRQN